MIAGLHQTSGVIETWIWSQEICCIVLIHKPDMAVGIEPYELLVFCVAHIMRPDDSGVGQVRIVVDPEIVASVSQVKVNKNHMLAGNLLQFGRQS